MASITSAVAHERTYAEPSALQVALERNAKYELRDFYAARDFQPIWIMADGQVGPAAESLVRLLDTAELDAVSDRDLRPDSVRRALVRAANGGTNSLARAELKLSEALVRFVQAMRDAPRSEMDYESGILAPAVPTAIETLKAAALAPSLPPYIEKMGWMHPLYAPLREALRHREYTNGQREVIWKNLERLRALPANPADRYILVDTAAAQLWMYEDGKPVDTMRVVVGKAGSQTPAMAGFVRYAILNPYWNVPTDLVQKTIAPNVLEYGTGYLKARRYQALSDWSKDARPVDPRTIDWKAIADGSRQVHVRQLPGGPNFMGKVKYEFPNPHGIYLHDTPDKDLLEKDARQFSNGCVRLEDAGRLGRWLMGEKLPARTKKPEQRIDLPEVVPVYITYLTAVPENGKIVFREDVYGRDDAPKLASAE